MGSPQVEERGATLQDESELDLIDALAQLTFMVQASLAKRAAAHNLSMIQTRLLGILRDREPTMQEVARLLELDKSSVTGLIDRAERRGLVQRTPSRDDRRAVHVTLTRTGRQTIRKVGTAFQRDIEAVTACLTPRDREQLTQLAARVITSHASRLPAVNGR